MKKEFPMADDNNKSMISDNAFEGKSIVTFPAESLILKEGEVSLDMYKIIQGKAEMYIGYGTDKEVLIGIIGPGACFSELGLLMKAPSIYTIIAYTDVYCIRVTEGRIGDFIQENHSSILQIMKNMARNMVIMQRQILELSEELASLTKKEDDTIEELKKALLRENYGVGMKGKMFFLGDKGK
jgi:CRP-like cAMP-binding protein